MSFKVTPKLGPNVIPTTGSKTTVQMSARERAIQRLTEAAQPEQAKPTPAIASIVAPDPQGGVAALAEATSPMEGTENNSGQPEAANSAPEATVATPPAVEEKQLSSQYAALARKEKMLRQRDQEIKARDATIRAKEEALAAKEREYQSGYVSKDRLKAETLSVLAEEGIATDELVNRYLNAPKTDPATEAYLKRLEAKIADLEGGQKKITQSYEDSQTQQYQQAVKQIRQEAQNLVKSDPAFETVAATNSVGDVVQLIEETFKKDGILLTVEEAAQQVEEYLVDEAMKMTRLQKIQQRLKSNSEATKPATQPTQPKTGQQQSPQMKTLTNAVGTSRQLSARERAILAAKGELQKQ